MNTSRVALATAKGFWELDEDAPLLLEALRAADVEATPAIWDDPSVRWEDFDLVVIRSVWDYPQRRDEFLRWVAGLDSRVPVANPAEVVRWNTDKVYLEDLAQLGIDVVPSRYVKVADPDRADRIEAALDGLDEIVVKPTVSAGSRDAGRWNSDRRHEAAAHAAAVLDAGKDVMIQPYLRAGAEHREIDVVCFDGAASHAVGKGPMLATEGEVSVAPFAAEHITAEPIDDAHRAAATKVMTAVQRHFGAGPLLYGRVDLLSDGSPTPRLLEVELTEPSLFLSYDPDAATSAAAAIASRVHA